MRRCCSLTLRVVALATFGLFCYLWGRQESAWQQRALPAAMLDSGPPSSGDGALDRYLDSDFETSDIDDDPFSALGMDEAGTGAVGGLHRTAQRGGRIEGAPPPLALAPRHEAAAAVAAAAAAAAAGGGKASPPRENASRTGHLLPEAVPAKAVLKGFVNKAASPHDHTKPKQLCVWVSDKYRFIGVKFAKTGGSTVTKVLKGSLCGIFYRAAFASGANASCDDASILNHGQAASGSRSKEGRPVYPSCDRKLPDRWKWRDYFVFAFVRNPLSRRASMVKYCMDGTLCEACLQESCGRCSQQHCHEMSSNVLSPAGEPYVDYIGDTENMQHDLGVILAEIDRRHRASTGEGVRWLNDTDMTGLWENRARSGKIRGGTSFAAFARCPGCVEHTQRLYARDVGNFGFALPPT